MALEILLSTSDGLRLYATWKPYISIVDSLHPYRQIGHLLNNRATLAVPAVASSGLEEDEIPKPYCSLLVHELRACIVCHTNVCNCWIKNVYPHTPRDTSFCNRGKMPVKQYITTKLLLYYSMFVDL